MDRSLASRRSYLEVFVDRGEVKVAQGAVAGEAVAALPRIRGGGGVRLFLPAETRELSRPAFWRLIEGAVAALEAHTRRVSVGAPRSRARSGHWTWLRLTRSGIEMEDLPARPCVGGTVPWGGVRHRGRAHALVQLQGSAASVQALIAGVVQVTGCRDQRRSAATRPVRRRGMGDS